MIKPEVRELLEEAKEQLMDMWHAADDSVADYTLMIETAVNFIEKALKTDDQLDAYKALYKAFEVLEKEYDETPPDEEYDDLVDRIKNMITESDEEHDKALRKTGFWGKQGAGAIILSKSTGRILIPKRSAYVLQPGTWGVWGGAIDPGEDPAEAAKREIKEEIGYRGFDILMVPMYVFKDQKSGFQYHNFLAVVDDEFTPNLNWETEKFQWVEYGNWPSPLHFGLKAMLRHSGADIQRVVNKIKGDEMIKESDGNPIVISRP